MSDEVATQKRGKGARGMLKRGKSLMKLGSDGPKNENENDTWIHRLIPHSMRTLKTIYVILIVCPPGSRYYFNPYLNKATNEDLFVEVANFLSKTFATLFDGRLEHVADRLKTRPHSSVKAISLVNKLKRKTPWHVRTTDDTWGQLKTKFPSWETCIKHELLFILNSHEVVDTKSFKAKDLRVIKELLPSGVYDKIRDSLDSKFGKEQGGNFNKPIVDDPVEMELHKQFEDIPSGGSAKAGSKACSNGDHSHRALLECVLVLHDHDQDNDGRLTQHELGEFMSDHSKFKELPESVRVVVAKMHDDMGTRGDEYIDITELEHFIEQEFMVLSPEFLVDLFNVIDKNGDGYISVEELKYGRSLNRKDAETLFKIADHNGDGRLDREEFIEMMLSMVLNEVSRGKGKKKDLTDLHDVIKFLTENPGITILPGAERFALASEIITEMELHECGSIDHERLGQRLEKTLKGMNFLDELFEVIDTNKDGFITVDELQAGYDVKTKQAEEMFKKADRNGDGVIDREEFNQMMESVMRDPHGEFSMRALFDDQHRDVSREELTKNLKFHTANKHLPDVERSVLADVICSNLGMNEDGFVDREMLEEHLDKIFRARTPAIFLTEVFNFIDKNRDGFITLAELEQGYLLNREQALQIFHSADQNKDGRLSRREFSIMMFKAMTSDSLGIPSDSVERSGPRKRNRQDGSEVVRNKSATSALTQEKHKRLRTDNEDEMEVVSGPGGKATTDGPMELDVSGAKPVSRLRVMSTLSPRMDIAGAVTIRNAFVVCGLSTKDHRSQLRACVKKFNQDEIVKFFDTVMDVVDRDIIRKVSFGKIGRVMHTKAHANGKVEKLNDKLRKERPFDVYNEIDQTWTEEFTTNPIVDTLKCELLMVLLPEDDGGYSIENEPFFEEMLKDVKYHKIIDFLTEKFYNDLVEEVQKIPSRVADRKKELERQKCPTDKAYVFFRLVIKGLAVGDLRRIEFTPEELRKMKPKDLFNHVIDFIEEADRTYPYSVHEAHVDVKGQFKFFNAFDLAPLQGNLFGHTYIEIKDQDTVDEYAAEEAFWARKSKESTTEMDDVAWSDESSEDEEPEDMDTES